MSIVVSTPQQINQHPANTSSAKALFSFPKAPRFQETKKVQNQKIAYDLPTTLTRRAASIGYGERYNFSKGKGVATPAPCQYQLGSEFSPSPVSKAFSFGIAREAYSKVFIKEAPPMDKSIPGPGQYAIPNTIGQASKYTMRPKTTNPQQMTTIYKNPGPGAYQIQPAINEKGNYFLSKYKSSMATTISPARSKRFYDPQFNEKISPGPGLYSPKLETTKDGSYFVSKFRSSMCRTHYHFDRNTISVSKLATPGPGTYRLPSDFGFYESKNKTMTISQSQPILLSPQKEKKSEL